MSNVTLRCGYSAANTARVIAAGGRYDATTGGYVVPDTATAIIAQDTAEYLKRVRAAGRMRANKDAIRTAGRIAGYSDSEIESALRTSGGDDL